MYQPEIVHEPGWFAVRLRPDWAERRRMIHLVKDDKGGLAGRQLQPREIAAAAHTGGFTDLELLAVAVAVVLAESQGYERAWNTNADGTTDRGIWQLNTIHAAITDETAYDPLKASRAAHSLWKAAGGFSPWVAYQTGVYADDSYAYRAALAVANFAATVLAGEQHAHPDRSAKHTLKAPLVSLPELRHLYPHVAGI